MSKTANINVRIEPEVKQAAVEMRQPRYNAETEAAIREAKQIAVGTIPMKTYDTVQELFEDLDSEC